VMPEFLQQTYEKIRAALLPLMAPEDAA
jgi:hypothetical protein